MLFRPSTSATRENYASGSNQAVLANRQTRNKTTTDSTMLIAKVSHEIRTPLNGIIGFTDLLREDGLSESQLSKIYAIQSASNSLMEIINELLDYSKLSSGLGSLETSEIHYSESRLNHDKTLNLALANLLNDCMGDYELLKNLISLFKQNALEFIGACRIHLKNKDYNGYGFASHKIKAGLAMLHVNSLLSIVEQVSRHSESGSGLEELEKLNIEFIREYSIVEKAIDVEMEKLGNIK